MAPSKRALADAAFAEALRHHQAGKPALAERLARKALAAEARHAESLNLLGALALPRDAAEAARHFAAAAAAAPGHAPYHSNLGAALRRAGRLPEAAEALRRALALTPRAAELHFNLGVVLKALGDAAGAEAAYRAALGLRADYPEALNNLGNALAAPAEAAALYRQALALRPDYAEAQYNLALAERALGRAEAAMAAARAALALRPAYPEALVALGTCWQDQDNPAEAAACFRQALALRPGYAAAHHNLGKALEDLGEAAEPEYRAALALAPGDAEARLDLCMASLPIAPRDAAESAGAAGRFDAALGELQAWAEAGNLAALGQAAGRAWPFWLMYRRGNHAPALARHGALLARAAAAAFAPAPPCPPARGRIRLGVVCGMLRRHSVWDVLLRGFVEALDRRRFELLLYHTGAATDAETERARGLAEGFVQGPLPVQAWVSRIAADAPDALLYPELGSDPASTALAALRLAPVQAAWWGNPVTTGLPTLDLFFSGASVEGPGAEAHYAEKLVRLPGSGAVPRLGLGEAEPHGLELEDGVLHLALCQTPYKADPLDDALWLEVARRLAPCRLWVPRATRHGWGSQAFLARLRALSLGEVVREMPWLSRPRFLGFLQAMDLYLDFPGFSGFTTAAQAAWAGVPIVTLEGEQMRQRLAAGLLRDLGLPEGIAASEAAYLALAERLAAEARAGQAAPRRAALRDAARGALDQMGVPAVRAMEDALDQAVRARR